MHIKAESRLRVVDSRTTVKQGESGFITIEGRADTKYTIETSYKTNSRIVNVFQSHITGNDGKTTFRWYVSPDTQSGTRPAIISGNGEHITLSHTVP